MFQDFVSLSIVHEDRALETRLKEHKRAVRAGENNSKVAQHANQCVHSIDFDHATIVDKARNFHERLFLQAWYSQRDNNAGNEHTDIPDVYKSLASSRAAVVRYVFAGVARAELSTVRKPSLSWLFKKPMKAEVVWSKRL